MENFNRATAAEGETLDDDQLAFLTDFCEKLKGLGYSPVTSVHLSNANLRTVGHMA